MLRSGGSIVDSTGVEEKRKEFQVNTSLSSDAEIVLLVILVVWELIWKGFALWRAGRNNHPGWFVALLIINTVGILPIVYLATHRRHDVVADVPTQV